MIPSELDEYPIHQSSLSMARVATSDRNFYDRSYLHAHDRTGDIFFIGGMGFYPHLGVKDSVAVVRRHNRQWVLRCSDALDNRSLEQCVGPYRIEVIEPLRKLRLICEHEWIGFDMTWEAAFPAVLEHPHLLLTEGRPTLDAQRFAQVGSWEGTLYIEGEDIAVTPDVWTGARDRSWGIRPVGEAEPQGRSAERPLDGFWWLYVPVRFDDFALIVILQEEANGYRTLNDARRVFSDGTVEQLGWPRVEIDYRPGTRDPTTARLHLTTRTGKPLLVELETLTSIALHIGAGYGGDPDWAHGQWMGREWVSTDSYNLTAPDIVTRVPWGISDHIAHVTCEGQTGWGMLEHACMGRHDPSGFADWHSLAH